MATPDPLKDKIGVLYVLKDDPKSDNALKFARLIPEIYVQYVNLLPIEQIPKWLKDAPTFVTMENKKIKQIYPGTEAFEVLNNLYLSRKSAMESFSMPPPPPPIQSIPCSAPPHQQIYQMQQMQQMQQTQANRMPYPTQQQSQQSLRTLIPENSRMMPQLSQPPYPQPSPQQQYQQQSLQSPPPPPYPPFSNDRRINLPPQNNGQQMGQQRPMMGGGGPMGGGGGGGSGQMDDHPGSLKFSSQPSTGGGSGGGTVQYGCSLDMAFLPIEDAPIENDVQYGKGKVDQRDLEMYQRMREQSGRQGNAMGMLQ
jgi:hypothetical protein